MVTAGMSRAYVKGRRKKYSRRSGLSLRKKGVKKKKKTLMKTRKAQMKMYATGEVK
jgi:hypothetical protein